MPGPKVHINSSLQSRPQNKLDKLDRFGGLKRFIRLFLKVPRSGGEPGIFLSQAAP